MLNDVNIADIKAFVAIVQLGSLTRAAEHLDVSRSRISRQLVALEASLGATLLVRTTRTQRLTEQGETFYNHCSKALYQIEQAVAATADDVDSMRGGIRINCVGGPIGEDILATIVSDFMLENPDVDVSLSFDSRRVDLIEDAYDLIFRMGMLEDASFIGRKLTDIEMSTLASPKYLNAHGKPADPQQLKQHECLTGSVKEWEFIHKKSPGKRVQVSVKGRFTSKNGRVMMQAAKAGVGIIRVPRFYCAELLDNGELEDVLADWQPPQVPFYLVYPRDKYQPLRIKVFVNFCVERFKTVAM